MPFFLLTGYGIIHTPIYSVIVCLIAEISLQTQNLFSIGELRLFA